MIHLICLIKKTTKTNENNNNAILIPSNDVKVEQNVLFMTSPDNNDNNGLFLEQTDNKNIDNPLNITTSDTPKQEPLFATPTEQRKTGVLYATNMDTANNLFSNDNQQYNVQQNNEFMTYISQDNNTGYQVQSYQDVGNTIQNSSVTFMDNQAKISDIQDNNIPFFSNNNNNTSNNVQNNNIPFFTSDNTTTTTVQDNSIPYFSTDNSITNNNGLYYGTTTDNSIYNQNNPALFYNTSNIDTAPMNDIYNQNSPTKFYISSGNATPLSTDMFNNNTSFSMPNTVSPIKNEDSNKFSSLPPDSVEKTESVSLFGQEAIQQVQNGNDSSVKTETVPFIDNNTVPIESTSKVEPLSFFANDNNTVYNNMVPTQDNSIPFFGTTTQEASSIPLFSDSQSNTDNKNNNILSINTSNQNSYNNNSNKNEMLPSASIFDNLTNQYTSNNASFFDNQANGANWFEQFSQSSEPITPSSNIPDNVEKQISPELQKSKLSNNVEINPLDKDTLSTKDQNSFKEEPIVQNKAEEAINNLTIDESLTTTTVVEQISTNPVIEQSQANTLIEQIPANSVIEQVSVSPVKQMPEVEQAKLNSTEEPINNNELLELKQELNTVNNKLQESTVIVNELNQKLKQHEEQNASLIDKLKNIEESNKENVEKIVQHEKTIEQLNSLIKTKDQQIELLKEENDIDLESKDNSTEFNKLNELLKEKIEIIEQLTNEKQNFETEIFNQKKLLENKDIEFNNSQEKIKQLNEEISKIISNSDSNKNEINELFNQIQELQSLLNGKEGECNKLSKEKEELELENKKQLDEANNSYSQLESNYEALQEELKKSKEQNIALEQEMNLMKSNNINKEEKEFIQNIKELYPDLSLQDIVTKITNLNSEKEVVQPKPIDPSKTNNIQEINWKDMSGADNKDESESFYIKDDLNAFTPQPFLPVSDEQIKKYEEENNELKQKCNAYQEAMEKDKAEIEYLKDIIKNQKITQLPQLALNDDNGENHSLIEIISQLTKDNEALSLQIQELRQEVNSTNQASTSLTYPKQPYEAINSSSSYAYPSYLDTTQPSSDLVYNQYYGGGNGSGSKSMENKQGLNTYTSPYGNLIDNRVYEQPDYDLNYYDTSRLNSYTTPSSTYDHQQLLKQLDEREKNERNKMLASTSMSASQTDLLYKYNPYNY